MNTVERAPRDRIRDRARWPLNLPVRRDHLIGRERELALVAGLLVRDDVGLVTLIGAGGSGKTRLAVELAATLRDQFADGVCFVPLAPVLDPALVVSTVAQHIGVNEAGGRPLDSSGQRMRCARRQGRLGRPPIRPSGSRSSPGFGACWARSSTRRGRSVTPRPLRT